MYTESPDPREIERFREYVEKSDADGIDGSDGGASLFSVSLVIHVWEVRDCDDTKCVTPQVTQWIYPSNVKQEIYHRPSSDICIYVYKSYAKKNRA